MSERFHANCTCITERNNLGKSSCQVSDTATDLWVRVGPHGRNYYVLRLVD